MTPTNSRVPGLVQIWNLLLHQMKTDNQSLPRGSELSNKFVPCRKDVGSSDRRLPVCNTYYNALGICLLLGENGIKTVFYDRTSQWVRIPPGFFFLFFFFSDVQMWTQSRRKTQQGQRTAAVLWNICSEDAFLLGNIKQFTKDLSFLLFQGNFLSSSAGAAAHGHFFFRLLCF